MKGLFNIDCNNLGNNIVNAINNNLLKYEETASYLWNNYDFFISDSKKPSILNASPNIITVAIIYGMGNYNKPNELSSEFDNFRYWEDYDYTISWYDYINNDCLRKILNIKQENHILASLLFEGKYTKEAEKEFIQNNINALDWSFIKKIKNEMEQTPLFTVVTATYNLIKGNRQKTVQQCINSVREQSYKNIEHIVIDGASTDGTLDVLRKYEADDWLRVFSEPDKGIYDAMNKGIYKANGEYITFLNSDDYFCDLDAVKNVVQGLIKLKADYAYGNAVFINEKNGAELFTRNGNVNMLPFEMPYIHQTHVVKTSVMRALNGFDLSYPAAADYDITVRLHKQGYKHCAIGKTYAAFRLGGFSSESDATKQSHYDCARSFFTHYGREVGLTFSECKSLWYFQFTTTKSLAYQSQILSKISPYFTLEKKSLSIPYGESRKSKFFVGLRYIYDALFPGKGSWVYRCARKVYHGIRRVLG